MPRSLTGAFLCKKTRSMGTPSVSASFSGCLPWGWCFAGDGAQRTPSGAVQGVPSAFLLGYQKAKVLEIRRFRELLARREGFEPPAFWSVGCLKGKSESFRLRFVLFTTVRSADFPLFPSRPARFFRILGQKWVRHGAPAPTPTASRRPSRRRRQQDRPRRPHHSCSPAEYR